MILYFDSRFEKNPGKSNPGHGGLLLWEWAPHIYPSFYLSIWQASGLGGERMAKGPTRIYNTYNVWPISVLRTVHWGVTYPPFWHSICHSPRVWSEGTETGSQSWPLHWGTCNMTYIYTLCIHICSLSPSNLPYNQIWPFEPEAISLSLVWFTGIYIIMFCLSYVDTIKL